MQDSNALLTRPAPTNHVVQFYGDEAVLTENVGQYLKEGAGRGDWMIVIATPSHAAAFAQELKSEGVDVDGLLQQGRLIVHDAETTLSRLLKDGQPDWDGFDGVVGQLIRDVKARAGRSGIRAYGEMVDLLWKSGRLTAASQLEEFWNRALTSYRFGLYCSYTLDILGQEDQTGPLQEILRTHTHLLPVRTNGELDGAVDRALSEVLGDTSAGALMPLIRGAQNVGAVLPKAEATILWLRKNLPPYAGEVLARARVHYHALCEEHRK